jgi:putative transcriptional regulator
MKNRVRELRTQRGLAQARLADAMGVSRQTINSIENSRYIPSLPLAMSLARYFHNTVEVEIGQGHSGAPYTWLAAIGGLAYLAAVGYYRSRG